MSVARIQGTISPLLAVPPLLWVVPVLAEKARLLQYQDHQGGDKLFVDCGNGLSLVDPKTGAPIATELFAVWGASKYAYAEATPAPQLDRLHVRAFSYFGCLLKIVVRIVLRAPSAERAATSQS